MSLVRKCGAPMCVNPANEGARWCDYHSQRAAEREQARTERRRVVEVWRLAYETPEWKRAARQQRREDGNRCADCGKPGSMHRIISVHHRTPLWALWQRNGSPAPDDFDRWAHFLADACNPAILTSLCPTCHDAADNELRSANKKHPVYAKSRPKPSQRRRTRR